MKKLLSVSSLIMMLLFVFSFSGIAAADQKATKEECVAKCKEAAKQIKEIGLEAVLKKISDAKGEFVWKDSYVFCFNNETTKMLAHPSPRLIGFNGSRIKDSNGVFFMKEMMDLANAKGEGWVNYVYMNRKLQPPKPQPKTSYVLNVPDQKIVLAAGIFE
ncbi:MAG: sodium:calcium antiporter [Desulfobacteraceae bacterium]|nr:sodium:calcium antiporter [Desulfobacteraceae bacterium]